MQTQYRISEAERRFLLDGVAQGVRNDGRGCYDYRRVCFEMDPLPTATSSCRLRAGETDCLVSVKCDVIKTNRQCPAAGNFQVSVDCAASVSFALSDSWNLQEASGQLSALLETLCASDDVVDRDALCLIPGEFAWDVRAEILVLTCGGNLLDSVSLALSATLMETLLPKVDVVEAMEEGEVCQIRVDDRPEVGTPFPLKRLPLCVTVAQIQQRFLFDVTWEEELCADAMLCVVVDARCGDVMGLHKIGRGLFDLSAVPSMLQRCRAAAATLVQQLQRELADKNAD